MPAILLSLFVIFSTNIFAALPVLIRPLPIVIKPEFSRFRFQNIATRFNNSKEIVNYFNNDRIEGNFDPNQLNPSQRQLWNQLMADISAHKEFFNQDILKNLFQSLSGGTADIDSLIQMIMFQIAKDSSSDLRNMLDEMQKNQKKKRDLRNSLKSLGERINLCTQGNCGSTSLAQLNAEKEKLKNQLDSMSEMGEQEQLKLQMYMDRMSKFTEMLSNIMKKVSETSSQIISNLK